MAQRHIAPCILLLFLTTALHPPFLHVELLVALFLASAAETWV